MNTSRRPFGAYILVGKAGREFLAEGTARAKSVKRRSLGLVKERQGQQSHCREVSRAARGENQGTECVESYSLHVRTFASKEDGKPDTRSNLI